MPGRQSHGRPLLAGSGGLSGPKRRAGASRGKSAAKALDAFGIAAAQFDAPDAGGAGKRRRGGQRKRDLDPEREKKHGGGGDDADEDEEEGGGEDGDGEDEDTGAQMRKKRQRRGEEVEEETVAEEQADFDDFGSDSEGNEWHVGVGEDEDSEIDSDDAFGESDEERFDGFAFSGSSSNKKSKKKASKLEEEDADEVEDDEESLGDEAIDLAQALDLASDSDGESGSAQSGSDDEGDDQFSSVSSDVDGDEADEADAEGLKKLYRTVNGMSTEAATAAPDEGPASGGRRKITLQDLGLDSVRDPHIKKSLKLMTKEEKAAKSGTSRKLDVPLARRQQDRLLRVAAYEKSTKTLDRWQETVKFNRRADHLVFPLPQEAPDAGLDNSELLQLNSKGLGSELQQTILSIMKDSGMGPKAPRASKQDEDEEQQAISAADLYDLVAEKRRRREMESREQARAKRIKKIKSKAYHRVHKRQRIREMEKAAEAEEQMAEAGEGEGAGAGAGVSFHEAKEEHDRRRAEARMGTKHRESKWGKRDSKSRRAAWDDEYRESVAVAARRDEELRRRIDGRDGGEESDDENASSGGDEDEDGDILKQIDELEKDDGQGEESRLMQMPFMKKAEEALKKQNQEALRQVRRELEGDAEESEEEATEVGRRNFGGPKAVVDSAAMADDDDGELQVTARPPKQKKSAAKNFLSRQERPIIAGPSSGNRENSKETGAWSTPSRPEHGKGSWNLRPVVSVGEPKPLRAKSKKSGPDATANRHPLPAMAPAGDGDSDRGSDDSDAEATRGSEPADPSAPPSSHMRPVGAEETKKLLLARLLDSGSDDDGDDGDDGDGAAAAFAAEKRAVAAEDDDQVVDDTLPGWGTWAGPGVTKRRQQRRFLSVVKGVKKKEDRRDARLDKVIINEKRVKKNDKYLASQLPHPFESRQQYERSLRLPVGKEWVTRETFQETTKPRVIVKQGIIAPLSRPLL